MKKYSRVAARIDLDAVEMNFKEMRKEMQPDVLMTAVIKADGYGHGAVPIAQFLENRPYLWGFATATVEEAVELRKNDITKPILILGYTFEEHYDEIVLHDLRPAVFKMEMAEKLSKAAVRLDKEVLIHLALDTGMSRIGFTDTIESIKIISAISRLPKIKIEGLFTHFSKADETDLDYADMQFKRYTDFVEKLEEAGIKIPIKHCSNSAGILRMPYVHMDMVRAGITIYGLYPSADVQKEHACLHPVMSLLSHISYIKELEAGTPVSYGGTFVTNRKTKVATIPVGYADGYPRQLSNKGFVLIHGKKAPILGRVCMDQFMVDVTDIPMAEELDEVILIGKSGTNEITVEMLGELSGRFNYEFVCDINKRVPRNYIYHNEMICQRDHFS